MLQQRDVKDINTYGYYHLAIEIMTEILSWLPVKSLLRFKSVCKAWYDVINDLKFIKLHLLRSSQTNNTTTTLILFLPIIDPQNQNCLNLNFDPYFQYQVTQLCSPLPQYKPFVIGTCNGLVCFFFNQRPSIPDSSQLRLCFNNPATRTYKISPRVSYPGLPPFLEHPKVISFGYDLVSRDYKVFKLTELRHRHNINVLFDVKCMVYSLKTNTWNSIPLPPWESKALSTLPYIFVNNSFHWLRTKDTVIKCFDLSTHEYYVKFIPQRICSYSPVLTAFKGSLCVVTYYLDIWVLKDHDDDTSWFQIFRNIPGQLTSLDIVSGIWDSDLSFVCVHHGCARKFFLLPAKRKGLQKFLICCDLELEAVTKIEMPDLPPRVCLYSVQPFVESLVPLPNRRK